MHPVSAVILDMDGVIVDSEAHWKQAERPFFKEIIPDWREEYFERFVGLGVLDLYRVLVKEFGMTMSQERFLERCERVADEIYGRRVSLAPGLDLFFREMERSRIPLGLASSSPRPWIRKVLDRFGLHSRFHAVVSVDDVGGEGKPAPAIYLRAQALLRVPSNRIAAVEDSAHGVLSAKRAALYCIGFRNGDNAGQDLSLADVEAHGFHALLDVLGRTQPHHPLVFSVKGRVRAN